MILQHSRGDIELALQEKSFENGQLFWEYLNTNPETSNHHTYSEGQLFVKDPISETPIEVSNRRSIDSLVYKGELYSEDFDGENFDEVFLEFATEKTSPNILHSHPGDFYVFKEDNDYLNKGDLIIITKVTEKKTPTGKFRTKVNHIECKVLPTGQAKSVSDRLNYQGFFKDLKSFNETTEKVPGNLYLSLGTFYIPSSLIEDVRHPGEDFTRIVNGDFILWKQDLDKWVLIPSGVEAKDINYSPDKDSIYAITTFENYHKQGLSELDNVQDALNFLSITKAQLGPDGKVPLSQLPDLTGLQLQGKFLPIKDYSKPDLETSQKEAPVTNQVGAFWIIDCVGVKNLQYKKLPGFENIELNSGDYLVWTKEGWSIIDNSDRITSIQVVQPDGSVAICLSDVTFKGKKIKLYKEGSSTLVIDGSQLLTLKDGESSKQNYLPKFADDNGTLTNSEIYEWEGKEHFNLGFEVGDVHHYLESSHFGNLRIKSTEGATKTTLQNNYLVIESTTTNIPENDILYRETYFGASIRNNFTDHKTKEALNIYMPELSSVLVGVRIEDSLTPNYITKAWYDGFETDSLISEIFIESEDLQDDFEDGYHNMGLGRTVSEDFDTGEITFYAKSKDTDDFSGFYTRPHSEINSKSDGKELTEHFLNKDPLEKTHLVIHPSVLREHKETFVRMPPISGTLLVDADIMFIFGDGIPLMLPAWELQKDYRGDWTGEWVGLDTSPVTIRTNRKAHRNTYIDRTNDISKDYGAGKKSTWTYINSSKNSQKDVEERRDNDNPFIPLEHQEDVVTVDAWLEAQRAIATKEGFVIPSTMNIDDDSKKNPITGEMEVAVTETRQPGFNTKTENSQSGKYQMILPSRSLYKDEYQYYDPFTGELILQNTTTKDVEMPAVGGVLLTSRSRIEGGFWS